MTNRDPAMRRSQNPSSHQSIEDAPPMMRRMGGVGPIAECLDAEVDPVCPDDPLVELHRPNLGTRRGRLLWDLAVVAVRHDGSFLDGCSIVQLEHTAIDLRSTINPSPLERFSGMVVGAGWRRF